MKKMMLVITVLALTASFLLAQKAPQSDEFRNWMKDIQAQVRNFNDAYNAMDKAKAATAIDALKSDFEKVQAHWEKQAKTDAVNWSKDAVKHFTDAQAKMKREDIAYALNLLQLAQKNCKACHDVYRPAPATKSQQ